MSALGRLAFYRTMTCLSIDSMSATPTASGSPTWESTNTTTTTESDTSSSPSSSAAKGSFERRCTRASSSKIIIKQPAHAHTIVTMPGEGEDMDGRAEKEEKSEGAEVKVNKVKNVARAWWW